MNGQAHGGVVSRLEHLRDFFSQRIWDARLDRLPPRTARRYRRLRLLYCTIRGLFFDQRLALRAAALTYYTILSLVPLLAFAFALLKGFGAYDALIERMVWPWVLETFGGNPQLRSAFAQVLDFVADTSVASLGFLGLLLLLYAARRLLHNIEAAL